LLRGLRCSRLCGGLLLRGQLGRLFRFLLLGQSRGACRFRRRLVSRGLFLRQLRFQSRFLGVRRRLPERDETVSLAPARP